MANIYIVEDNTNIQEIEAIALKNSGHNVEQFEDAKHFYKKIEEKLPDLAILDIMLPDENGYEIVKKLRKNPATKKLPIIMVTAKTSEIDMVINIGWLKDKKYDLIENEIRTLKAACGEKILKVIIETCFLTTEEKIKMCEIVTAAGADYIKTSTGFGGGGATFEDIELFSKHVGPNVKMKAAGGISSLDDAEKFLSLGADRLGTSRIIKIVKNEEATGY